MYIFAVAKILKLYIMNMATAQNIWNKGQQICRANQLLAASGVLHRVQGSYAMTLRLC